MNAENWENIKDLFSEAIEKPPEERDVFLEQRCRNKEMLEEVRQLLNSYDEDDEFLEKAAVSEVADFIVTENEEKLFAEPVGRYEVKSLLGEGGMGKVYLAKDTQLERLAAIKILSPYYSEDAHRTKRFFQEAKSASALNHPNILTIYEIGSFKDTYFIAAEYIKGETLRQRQNRKKLSISEITKVLTQVASALDAAHAANIVHRDIKPENIMIRNDGLVKILDFGLAKLVADKLNINDSQIEKINLVNTAPRVVLGTVAYMSPEQARGKATDFRTDIWSFGICLYELLAGTLPFKGETMNDQIAQILTADPLPLTSRIPSELIGIVHKSLQKDAEMRYQTAKELVDDLTNLQNSLQGIETTEKITSYSEIQNTSGNRFKTVLTQITAPFSKNLGTFALVSVLAVTMFLMFYGFYGWQKNETYMPNPEAVRWFQSGNEAARNGNYFKAKKMLEQAVQIDDKYLFAHAKLADIWFQLDYEDKAAQTMLHATELIPQLRNLAGNEELYLQAVSATVRRDYKLALINYEKIVENTPEQDKVYALFDVGRVLEKAEDYQRAREIYEEIARRDPQSGAAYLRLASIYWFDEERSKALDSFEKASAIFNAQSDYDSLGELYYLKGSLYGFYDELAESEKNLTKSLELAKATNNSALQVKTLLELGYTIFSLGDNQKGKEIVEDGLKLAQTENLEYFTTNGLIDLGTNYYLKGEYAEAEKYIGQALQIARLNGGKQTEARALISLGSVALLKNKSREAISYIEPALKFYSENNFKQEKTKSLLSLGIAYEQTGKYPEAIRLMNELVEDAKNNDDISIIAQGNSVIGLALTHSERYSQALKFFETSLETNKSLGKEQISGYDYLGKAQALTNLGRFDEAAQMLRLSEKAAVRSEDKRLIMLNKLENAQKNLFEANYRETLKLSHSVFQSSGELTDDVSLQANLLCTLAELRSGNLLAAEVYYEKAAKFSESVENPQTIADLKLVGSELYLKKNQADSALESALEAHKIYSVQSAKQSEWRALALAGAASLMLHNEPKASEYKSRSNTLFESFKELWGNENFQKFRLRKDVKLIISQTDKIEG